MKKTTKKSIKTIMCFMLCTFILLSINTFVSAAKVGAIVGKVVYSDIVARINEYDIASFNINGDTAIVVEDLRNYGCDVQWDAVNRTLNVTRANTSKVASTYTAPTVPKKLLGKKAYNILHSDIKTYVNGHLVPSYNIGGKTIINLASLVGRIGYIHWDEKNRVITLTISGLDRKPSTSTSYQSYSSNTSSESSYSGSSYSSSSSSTSTSDSKSSWWNRCGICGGNGKRIVYSTKCDRCNGNGYRYNSKNVPEQCGRCYGDGMKSGTYVESCSSCNGTGYW